jgi:signal transduction histidine kinase/CheY-like chemotaxis protein
LTAGLAVIALGFNLFVYLLVGFSLYKSHQRYLQEAEISTSNLAQSIEIDIAGVIGKIDIAILAAANEAARQFAGPEPDQKGLSSLIPALWAEIPELEGLRVADRHGRVRSESGLEPSGPVSIADRAYFTGPRDNPEKGLVISPPLRSPQTGKWVLILARRINFPDGSFAGVAYGTIALDYFRQLFSLFNLGQDGVIALLDGELAVIARYPEPGGAGSAVGAKVVSELGSARFRDNPRTGTYEAQSRFDNTRRIYSYRKISRHPMTIFVGQASSEFLAPWRKEGAVSIAMAALFTLLTAFTAWMLHLKWTGERSAEEERSKLEIQLLRSQKMESLGSLAGGVAHDMNNVLGAILGLASAHLETQPTGGSAHRAFETICKAAVRGGKLMRGLLDFARKDLVEVVKVDLNELIQDQVHLLERTTFARIELQLRLAPDVSPILGDASSIAHAFMNLCVNAVDAMPQGGTLILRTRNRPGAWVEVEVEDTGCGMPKEVMEKALDPFFTTKAQGKGTGLGLSLVYSTVKAHHGELEIHSEPGQGTRVSMRFPAAETPATQAPDSDACAPPGSGSRLTVLLVDDDDLILDSTRAMVEMLGHTALAVRRGEEALDQLEAGKQPDLVVLDLNMPGLGGAETLARLRALRPAVPVLLATGRADQTALDLVEAHSGVTLLPKPFSMEDLRKRLESLPSPGRGAEGAKLGT